MRIFLVSLLASAYSFAAPIIVSTFDVDDEGWTVNEMISPAGAISATYVNSGGNPGGHIQTADPFVWTSFYAPAAFLGDWAAMGVTSLAFDLRLFAPSDGIDYATLVLQSGSLSISTFGPYPLDGIWNSYAVQTTSPVGWFYTNDGMTPGAAVSVADFNVVMQNVQSVRISADWTSGGNIADLDNVTLHAVPEPAAVILVGSGLAWLALRRRVKS